MAQGGRRAPRGSPRKFSSTKRRYFKCHDHTCKARLIVDVDVSTGNVINADCSGIRMHISSAPRWLMFVNVAGEHNHPVNLAPKTFMSFKHKKPKIQPESQQQQLSAPIQYMDDVTAPSTASTIPTVYVPQLWSQ